jgi:dTDP-4-amino-4,6-dideoxygalactose transaminase
MQTLGYNYRLTDFQAALGSSQLQRAEQGLTRRRAIAANYENAFKNMSYILSQSGVVDGHAYHLYVIQTLQRKELYDYLRSKNIFCQVHYIPVHKMPYYQQLGQKYHDLEQSEKYYDQCLSLPMFPTLTSAEQAYVINCIDEFFNK